MSEYDEEVRVSDALRKTLDRHGYSFQYAVLRHCHELEAQRGASWKFEVAEFPVTALGGDTRIDFVLHVRNSWNQTAYLVCECKRVYRRLAGWAFVRSAYWRSNRNRRSLVLERIRVEDGRLFATPHMLQDASQPYDLSVELKIEQKTKPDIESQAETGDLGFGRGNIELAATQVLKGVSGFIDFFKNSPRMLSHQPLVIPVILTNADLYESDVDLGSANLQTGSLGAASVRASRAQWLWYQYNLSASLKHSGITEMPQGGLTSLGSVLEYQHSRSIAIVGVTGIESFLNQLPDKLDAVDPLRP